MRRRGSVYWVVPMLGVLLFIAGSLWAQAPTSPSITALTTTSAARPLGWRSDLGTGTVSSYAEFDSGNTLTAMGIVFSTTALAGLPTGSDHHHCFDRNTDGVIDPATECNETFEVIIPLPDAVSRRSDIPFKWVMLNWNPVGHGAPGIWDVPHFDIHFYLEPRIAHILAIRSGACGPEFVDCVHWEVGRKPLPPNYMHPDFQMGAVVPAMGGHLRDHMDPVYNKTQPAAHSWIFGAYDSHVIFYEAMVTRAFLLSNPDTCFPIKSPQAVALSGFYPTVSCVRHDAKTGESTVSIEDFVLREASGPEPVLAGK
jgi:hypothetical protein